MSADTLSGRLLENYRASRTRQVFDAFYALNAGWVTRTISRSGGAYAWSFNHTELASEVFHDVFRYCHSYNFQGGPAFRRWIQVLIRNRIRKAIRSFRVHSSHLSTPSEEIPDHGMSDPFNRMLLQEENDRLLQVWWLMLRTCQKGIEKTSALEQASLRLHELEGLRYQDLSMHLNISVSEVSALLRRSRRKVARYMSSSLYRKA